MNIKANEFAKLQRTHLRMCEVHVPEAYCTYWCVVTLKNRCENCGAESSGPCGAGKLRTNITGFREKYCLDCLKKATESLAIRSG